MKKPIANSLKEVAATLPRIFQWEPGNTVMTGKDLNLTPLAKDQKFEPSLEYEVFVPQLRAVTHEQQLKDAFKRGGMDAVDEYVAKVKKEEFGMILPNYVEGLNCFVK